MNCQYLYRAGMLYLVQKPGSQHWRLCISCDLEIMLILVLSLFGTWKKHWGQQACWQRRPSVPA